jgi:hypothetical protein
MVTFDPVVYRDVYGVLKHHYADRVPVRVTDFTPMILIELVTWNCGHSIIYQLFLACSSDQNNNRYLAQISDFEFAIEGTDRHHRSARALPGPCKKLPRSADMEDLSSKSD